MFFKTLDFNLLLSDLKWKGGVFLDASMKTAAFLLTGKMYCIMDTVNSQGNSGMGTLAE